MNQALTQLQQWPTTPWVRVVLIQNNAGQLQGEDGTSASLGNRSDRDHLIKVRNSADLVITGAATIRAENPPAPTTNLWVFSSSGNLDPSARIFQSSRSKIISVIPLPELPVLQLDPITPENIIAQASAQNLTRVLIEGGANLINQFISNRLIDEALITLVDRPGSGQILHRSQFGLTLTQQFKSTELTIQQWRKEN